MREFEKLLDYVSELEKSNYEILSRICRAENMGSEGCQIKADEINDDYLKDLHNYLDLYRK